VCANEHGQHNAYDPEPAPEFIASHYKFFIWRVVPMFSKSKRILLSMAGAAMATALLAGAQTPAPAAPPAAAAAAPAAAPTPPAPLSTFVLTGPLTWLPPATFDAGPLGKLSANGIITGYSLFQDNYIPGDAAEQATLSNGQVFIQREDENFNGTSRPVPIPCRPFQFRFLTPKIP